MKITPIPPPDLPLRPNPKPKRKPRPKPRPISIKTPKKGGPPTPLLRWKERENDVTNNPGHFAAEESPESGRRCRREKGGPRVSSRKLAAVLWRLQVAESGDGGGEAAERSRPKGREVGCGGGGDDGLGFKPEVGPSNGQLSYHHASRECDSEAKDPLRSPCSVNGPINGYYCKWQSSLQISNYAMESATKWDPVCSEASNENLNYLKLHDHKVNAVSTVSALKDELEQARLRTEELETERRSSKKKLEHFLKKLSEERAAWRSREHEKVRAIIDDVKGDLNRERKNRQRLEIVNSKLVNELAEVKVSAKRYILDYEKERKARQLLEEVCDELAKEIGEDKAAVGSLKKECLKIREEVEDERKMLQMAEVWREERVQMKLIDAKVLLHKKYSQMNLLVTELEKFLRLKGTSLDVNDIRVAEMLQRAAASVDIQDIKEFTYERSNSDDIFAVVEEMAMAESNEREIEPCVESSPTSHASKVHTVSPEISYHNKNGCNRFSSTYANPKSYVDDDGSGWETVSRAEDQGSSYSPEGSIISVNKICGDSDVSGSCTGWEEQNGGETPVTQISEVCSVQSKHVKKVKSFTRLWRSCPNNGDNYKVISVDGVNGKLLNGRFSNGVVVSPDHGSGKGGINLSDMERWSSPDSGKPQINRGMKGCIEWPLVAQNGSLKHKLLEARLQNQKIQIRHVLKQKI